MKVALYARVSLSGRFIRNDAQQSNGKGATICWLTEDGTVKEVSDGRNEVPDLG